MKVLAIDPGSIKTGFACLEKKGRHWLHLGSGSLFFDKDLPMSERLLQLRQDLVELLSRYQPEELALEKAFFAKNAQSALKLGQARGVILMTAAEKGIPIWEYSATQVKSSICGSGRASKLQVEHMLRLLLKLSHAFEFSSDDQADALAIALTHGQIRSSARGPQGEMSS
jgi:crossover junction endodeoxyribonuclease RuvC